MATSVAIDNPPKLWYNYIMNLLKHLLPELFDEDKAFSGGLPKVTRFQILMILATMWAFIFALIVAEFIAFGITVTTSLIAHGLVIGGIIFTRKNLNQRIDGYNGRANGGEHEWTQKNFH